MNTVPLSAGNAGDSTKQANMEGSSVKNMTAFRPDQWHRIKFGETPVYLSREEPDWFVPNLKGDEIIRNLHTLEQSAGDIHTKRFLHSLPPSRPLDYRGRSAYLELTRLNELWFHITNRCNLSCQHCLFSSSPKDKRELEENHVLDTASQAARLGCNVFVLTGGEPFIHPEIKKIINGLLDMDNTHLVILTNGMNLPSMLNPDSIDTARFHLQISVDGIGRTHDQIRGKGAFERLSSNLDWLKAHNIPYTISMCVTSQNVTEMADLVKFAARYGAGNVHFMWYFIRGRGDTHGFVPIDTIFEHFLEACETAFEHQVTIDNVESFKTQIFAPRGTIHDGTTAAWESLAIGPDGKIYPSAALVDIPELASDMSGGLEDTWRNSPVLKEIRNATAISMTTPFRFIHGGGDMDHSYIHKKTFIGDDPYLPLYEKIGLWLISQEASRGKENGIPRLKLRMGEILESCGAHGKVALAHPNCLLATASENSLSVVKSFYSQAAGDKRADILNPVSYDEGLMSHIPDAFRFRGYGCGSPVMDSQIKEGESVVDLGCGTGVECFIASRLVGATGRVVGVDMLDPMLELAERGSREVIANLGYNNLEFRKGYLEDLPLEDNSVDVIISNCVMNLSVHKRKAFSEIFRVLRPGGRLVISDVVCETEPDPSIRNDETLRGECIAGALTQQHLMSLLQETGFLNCFVIKRFPYRVVDGHPFFSMTFSAIKPVDTEEVRVVYRGPAASLVTNDGTILFPGDLHTIPRHEAETLNDQLLILDESGNAINVEGENTCCCSMPPEALPNNMLNQIKDNTSSDEPVHKYGCLLCGAPIKYLSEPKEAECIYCHRVIATSSICENGHFVCDDCHRGDAGKIIEEICVKSNEKDMITLLKLIRSHPRIPMHGPEHHMLVPGIILSAYRNVGGDIPSDLIVRGIRRGETVAGGNCAYMGACGAAVGAGIAFSLILEANPLTPKERKIAMKVTEGALKEISRYRAARCCQRESWITLKKAAELSEKYLDHRLLAEDDLRCTQKEMNRECLGKGCPLY